MKRALKNRIVATITSLFMLGSVLNVFPIIAFAEYSKANFDMVYFGNEETPATSPIETLPNVSEMSVGDKIWVGINLSNLSNIELNTNPNGYDSFFVKGSDTAGTAGIYNIATGYNYLTKYLEPVSSQDWGGTTAENIANDYTEVYWPTYEPWVSYASKYTPSVVIGDASQLEHESATPTALDTNYDIGNVYIDITSSNTLNRVYNTTLGDELLASLICFEIKEVPPAGVKVLEASLNAHDFILQTGTNGERWGANWNNDPTVTEAINLNNYFVYGGILNLNPATYTVTYMNGSSEVSTESVVEDGYAASIPDESELTAPDNKYFDGWYYDASGDNDEANATTEFDNTVQITADTTVYAKWSDPLTVKFHSNYDDNKTDGTDDETLEAYANPDGRESVSVPSGVSSWSKEGYSLSGWQTSDGSTFTPDETLVTADTDVYAIWSQDYKVEFQKVEGSSDADNVLQTSYVSLDAEDKTVAAPTDPTRDGYKFNGWYYYVGTTKTTFVPKGSTTDTPTTISGDTKVYADWIKQVTVKYYDTKAHAEADDGSTGLLASETVDENTLYTALTKRPSVSDNDETHKYFKGWTKTDGTVVDFTDISGKVTENLIVYQDWGNYYKLDFYTDKDDMSGTPYATEYVNPNVETKLTTLPTTPTKDGYGFNEWRVYDSNSSAVTTTKFDTSYTVTGDMVLVADWTEKITITFHKNDGTTPETTNEVQITPSVNFDGTAPTYRRDNYTFKEWNTESNGSGTGYTSLTSAQFSASDDLYAIWTADGANQATLTFDANLTGVTPNPSAVTVNSGDKVYTANIPVVSKDDYTFNGWYASPSITDTTAIDFDSGYTLSENTTVYAHWTYTGTDKVTVTFMNGDTQYATVDVAPNTTLGNLMPANPEKSGYSFKEWNTASDGEGSAFTSSTSVGTASTLTVYAQYAQDITVNYNANGGDGAPDSVTKPAGDAYENPTTTPTKAGVGSHSGYKFLGWNTKQNGGGTYVPGTNTSMTYQDVADLYATDGTTPASVTLYAQWGALDSSGDPDPAQEAVTVTFDGNGTTQYPVTKEANPKNKYPQLGDTIGANNMPDSPERTTNYTFAGWNTKADGSGTEITETTVFNAELDGMTAANDGTYTITAYAQWTVASDYTGDTITLTFNSNTDGKGNDSNPIKKTIVKGDSLGYDISAPSNDKYEFIGWFTGSIDSTTDKVVFDTTQFSSTTAYTADTTFYAKYILYLLAEPQTTTDKYTGSVIKPKYDIYRITYPNGKEQAYTKQEAIATGIDFTETDSPYQVTYTKNSSTADLREVGDYTIEVSLKDDSELKTQGANIAVTAPATFTVTQAPLTVKVAPDTQVQKSGDTVSKATISVTGLSQYDPAESVYEINYYLWNDADNDNLIDSNELTAKETPTDVGKYVVKVEMKNSGSNYKVDSVESSVEGKNVLLYGQTATADYPGYPGLYDSDGKLTVVGQNIIYEIQANDPSISGVTVKSADTEDAEGNETNPEVVNNLSLKGSDYTTDVTFDSAENPETTEYYIRVTDVDADEVRFTVTLTNPDTTGLTANDGATVVKNSDGTYTVTAPLTNKGATANTVTITTTAGDASDAPTITYTFNVQQLVTPKITLNYGNSPYGEIMKDDAITDKDAAKADFDSSQTLSSLTTLTFYDEAWNSYLTFNDGLAYNGDKDDTSIFVYQRQAFKDPGFTLYDSVGEEITDASVINSVTLSLTMTSYDGGLVKYTNDDNPVNVTANGSGNNYVFNEFKSYNIRPDVYKLTYEFTDPISNEKVTTTRFVIAISRLGDVRIDANNIINNLDSSTVKTNSTSIMLSNSLYAFRIADAKTDANKVINNLDASAIKTVSMSLPLFYNALPTE